MIYITGAGGLVGNYLRQTTPGAHAVGLTRRDLELTNFPAVRAFFHRHKPTAVIHCAALSRSPACQANPELAWKINVDATGVIAELASEIPLIFFSSDLVFDGRAGNYDESAPVNPLSIYAQTKVAAEKIVLANPRHLVIRTSLNAGTSPTGDRSFNEELQQAWQSGQTVKLFTDEFRSPIAAAITARAVWELFSQNATGLYHVAGSERLSRWQIGQLLAARCPHLHPAIEAASLNEYQGAPRPPDTSLNCAKAQKIVSFPLPGFTEYLAGNEADLW